MFSISPKTGSATARVNERHFMASSSATACGVVTMTADNRECTGARCSRSDKCSSDVPKYQCELEMIFAYHLTSNLEAYPRRDNQDLPI
jgi:hypothetical protein